MATEHKTLHEALCAVQAEAETLPKDGVNPHFKSRFTPLDTIVERVGPLIARHGLTWSTFPCYGPDGQPALRYKLTHAASGDSESEIMPLLAVKADPQGLGAAVTYARRYSICAVLNLVADEDDDGNTASRRTGNGATTARPVAQQANGTERPASAKQRGLLNAKAGEAKLDAAEFACCLLAAAGQPSREFESPEQAQQFVNRQLDRLPGRLVDAVLAQIDAAKVPF